MAVHMQLFKRPLLPSQATSAGPAELQPCVIYHEDLGLVKFPGQGLREIPDADV